MLKHAVPATEIAAETQGDAAAIEALLDRAFGPGRHAKTSERVRENFGAFAPRLSGVARAHGDVIGCCRMWRIGVGPSPALFLGPIAVDPARQGQGLGETLARWTLQAARREGWADAVVLIGAPRFFAALDFERAPAAMEAPGAFDRARLLWLPLKPGARLAGAFSRPPAAIPP